MTRFRFPLAVIPPPPRSLNPNLPKFNVLTPDSGVGVAILQSTCMANCWGRPGDKCDPSEKRPIDNCSGDAPGDLASVKGPAEALKFSLF